MPDLQSIALMLCRSTQRKLTWHYYAGQPDISKKLNLYLYKNKRSWPSLLMFSIMFSPVHLQFQASWMTMRLWFVGCWTCLRPRKGSAGCSGQKNFSWGRINSSGIPRAAATSAATPQIRHCCWLSNKVRVTSWRYPAHKAYGLLGFLFWECVGGYDSWKGWWRSEAVSLHSESLHHWAVLSPLIAPPHCTLMDPRLGNSVSVWRTLLKPPDSLLT